MNVVHSQGMSVVVYGTRGSMSISRRECMSYGGNTTALRILSECLPKDAACVIDAGTGLFPLSTDIMKEGIIKLSVLFTHYHHDHTQGITMAPHTYHPNARVTLYGPMEHKIGPLEVMQTLMKAPFFPYEFERVAHRFKVVAFNHIGTQVMVIHPKAGYHVVPLHNFNKVKEDGGLLPLGKHKVEIAECLVVKMYKTAHPEYTVSYRFEEMPTGKVFVFLTDHENTDGFPQDLLKHVKDADLLIQDGQYSEEVYINRTAGFGHGTPEYVVRLALKARVKRLGITHHDPSATDEEVGVRISEAKKIACEAPSNCLTEGDNIFGCADYSQYFV